MLGIRCQICSREVCGGAVAYPGGFSGCPETPPAMIFFIQGGDTVTGTDLHQPFTTFGNPPPTLDTPRVFGRTGVRKKGVRTNPPNPPWLRACLGIEIED